MAGTSIERAAAGDAATVTLWDHVAVLIACLDAVSPRTPHEVTPNAPSGERCPLPPEGGS